MFSGDAIDLKLVHAVESVVIEWSHQIRQVLKKNSAQDLLDGQDPLPITELTFWKSKLSHLESIHEQVDIFTCDNQHSQRSMNE
jgi:dynein heavy chain, axonemal